MHRTSCSWSALGLALIALLLLGLATTDAKAQIILSDIVGGGDGTGNGPAAVIGIDPRNGEFTGTSIGGHIFETDDVADGVNPSPVGDSAFVDSVFFIGEAVFEDGGGGRVPPTFGGDPVAVALTQSGVEFEFPSEDGFGSMWNHVLSDLNAGGGGPFTVGGQVVAHGVGVHAAGGVTFDLGEIRSAFGADSVGCFQTVWGMDGCGSGDVNLYVILSSDTEVLETRSYFDIEGVTALANSGSLLQVDIPEEAVYLTLATGSNGGDGCDHGNFGLARIIEGACPEEIPLVSLEVTPPEASIAPDGLLQLSVLGIDDLGRPQDLTSSQSGTTYASDDEAAATVDADGLITGVADGDATITVSNGALEATVAITVGVPPHLDLGDMAVGGNGFGTADPLYIGINADTGAYVSSRLATGVPEGNFINPMPVDGFDGSDDNPFVNSVFVIETDVGQAINTESVPFDFEPGDQDIGWEAILSGREPGGDDFLEFGVREDGTGIRFTAGLGVHASQGITFDLEEIRSEHGSDAVQYVSAVAGELTSERNNAGSVNTYIILTDEESVLETASFLGASNSGRFLQMAIPEDAVYLTFAVGSTGNGIGSDHGGFGIARITREEIETELAGFSVTPTSMALNPGETRQIRVSGFLGGELDGITTDIDPADITFESEDDAIAEVDDQGNVLGESIGSTVVHVTVGETTVDVEVQVGSIIHLGDIVGAGDGTGTADGIIIGVDPRSGLFAEIPIDGHLYEGDPEGDGLNPSPVEDSEFIDSVFIIGERDPGAAANVPVGGPPIVQELTADGGVTFEFPSQEGFGSSWNHILANGGVIDGACLVGGQVYERGVGVHAAGGITFNLDSIREVHGDDAAGTFATVAGMDACGGNVNLYVIYSNDDAVLGSTVVNATGNSGESLSLTVPVAARYLTLACGSNGADGCDHGTFGDAKLLSGEGLVCPEEGDTHCEGLSVVEVGERQFLGTYPVDILATATDESGDDIRYGFTLVYPDGSQDVGSNDSGAFQFVLREGTYTMTVTVDDETLCNDAAADNTCTLEFTIPPDVAPEEDCDTVGDEDGNDLADCDDPVCADLPSCQQAGLRRGDADDNGQVQLTDAVNILGFLFQGSAAPTCMDAADADNNDEVQLTDAVRILGFLFQGSEPPVDPDRATVTHSFGSLHLEAFEERQPCGSWTLHNEEAIYVNVVTLANEGAWHHSNWFVVPETH